MSWLTPEWVSAFGTAIAALATIPLWIVSWRAATAARRSADAADISARAAMWIELPLLIGSVGDMLDVTVPVPEEGPCGGQVINDIPDRHGAITDLVLRNHGRSAARLELVRVGHAISAALPAEPAFPRTYACDQNMVIPPGEWESIDLSYSIELTPEQRAALLDKATTIWLYAEVIYLDFLDTVRKCGLAWSYSTLPGDEAYFFQPITTAAPKFRFRT